MEAIFDKNGQVVGWLDGNTILDRNFQHQAFLNNDNIYNYSGVYLGHFLTGFFRGKNGNSVAFIKGASNGPGTPIPSIPPVPAIPSIPPMTPIPEIPPIAPIATMSWSSSTFNDFLKGSS